MSGLVESGEAQAALFEDPDEARARRFARAADAVRDRLGEDAVVRARLLGRKRRGADDESEEPGEASSLPAVD